MRLAYFLGVAVAIEEPDAFTTGESTCGSLDELSNVALEQQWVVLVQRMSVQRFEAGVARPGLRAFLISTRALWNA